VFTALIIAADVASKALLRPWSLSPLGIPVGETPHSVVEGDVIFMLANALLAAVLGEDILGVQVAKVAIAADQARV
jgi:hypothetical protein